MVNLSIASLILAICNQCAYPLALSKNPKSCKMTGMTDNFLDRFEKYAKKTEKELNIVEKNLGLKKKTTIPEIKGSSTKLEAKVPSKDMTGVDPYITRLCATISGQIYDDNLTKKSFDLPPSNSNNEKPKLILLETHGIYEITNPPFAVVVVGQTMILAWRGSSTAMDWDRDFGFYISSSSRWKEVASSVKVQGAYLSIMENCMSVHESKIIEAIKEHNITELVCTGHSLAGGVAQVAHIYFEGSMSADDAHIPNVWKQLKDKLTVRTISFEGPMTTVFIKSKNDEENEKGMSFLKRCGDNMCTTAFQQDVVPRSYGMADYGFAMMDNMMDNFVEAHDFGMSLLGSGNEMLAGFVAQKLGLMKMGKSEVMTDYSRVMSSYRHLGNVIWYENYDSEPKVYADYGPNDDMSTIIPKGVPNFRSIEYKPLEGIDIYKQAYNDHMFLVKAPGLCLVPFKSNGLE